MKELKKYFCVHLYIQTLSNCHASLVCKPWCLSRINQYRARAAHFHMGGPNSFCGQRRERGGNLSPYDDIKGRFLDSPVWAFIFSKIPRAWFTPIKTSSHWGTIGRLGKLILRLKKPHKVTFSCNGTFKLIWNPNQDDKHWLHLHGQQ